MSAGTKTSTSSFRIDCTEHKAIQQDVDDCLRKLSDDILPKQPYIVTYETRHPWNPGSRQQQKWYTGTPFTRDEEALQYLSFIPHQREFRGEETALVSEGGWSDEHGGLLRGDPEPISRPPTSNGTQRKKITLNAYKNKGRADSEEVAPEMERAAASIRKADEALRSARSPDRPQVNGVKKDHGSESKKRMHEEMTPSSKPVSERRDKSPRPEKKPRTDPPPVKHQTKPSEPAKSSPKADTAFPKLESPTLPPSLGEIVLPPLLSPTLPPYLEKLLANKPVKPFPNGGLDRKRADSAASIGSNHSLNGSPAPGVRVRNADSPMTTPKITPTKGGDASSTRKNHVEKVKERSAENKQSPLGKDRTPKEDSEREHPRPKLRVTLRYGKKNRKRVEQLLRLGPRSRKAPIISSSTESPSTGQKREAQNEPERNVTQRQEKRPKLDDGDTVHVKKAPSSLNLADKPRTPVAAPFASPGMQSNFPRSTFSTPKKDLKSAAMRRVESTDGPSDAKTPQGISRNNTPVSAERHANTLTAKVSPPASNLNLTVPGSNGSTDGRRAWYKLNPKYFDLGRKLKHEGTAISSKNASSDSPENKRAIALWVEALLCFILANYCLDRFNPMAENGWRDVLPYWEFVRSQTRHLPDMYGLTLHLGALIRNVIHRTDMERLGRDPLPSEASSNNGTSAPTPGSDGTTKKESEEEKYRRKYLAWQKDCVDNFRSLSLLWGDATKRLGSERLEKKYPSTWSNKVVTVDRERDRALAAGDSLAGDYMFPIDASTTAIEGVRLGRRMVKEWCKNEDVKWSAQLEL